MTSKTTRDSSLVAKWLAVGASVSVLIVAFVLYPYQHWSFGERSSVIMGWYKTLMVSTAADWRFCLVVPVIVGFLVYRQRGELNRLSLRSSWLGLPLLAIAMFFFWMGYRVDTGYIGFFSIQLTIAALILLLAGVSWMRALFLPWAFLMFTWPLLPLDDMVAAKLQIPTAAIAQKVLSVIGISSVREGSAIQSAADFANGIRQGEKFTLDVAESCSGMRSLYALIMVTVLFSLVGMKKTIPRAILIASAIPLAIAGNVVRLILLALGCLFVSQEFAIGKRVDDQQVDSMFHLLAGFLVFGVALAGMFLLASWLEGRVWSRLRSTPDKRRSENAGAGHGAHDSVGRVAIKAMSGAVIVAAALYLCHLYPTHATFAPLSVKTELPSSVDQYASEQMEMTYKERVVFEEGVNLDRKLYSTQGGRPILATLVISSEYRRSVHPPEICLPNQGWTIASHETIPIRLGPEHTLNASVMRLFRNVEVGPGQFKRIRGINIYWYFGSYGLSTPSYRGTHLYSFRDAIFRNFNHRWSQVSFFTPLPEIEIGQQDGFTEVVALQELAEFAGKAAAQFVIGESGHDAIVSQ